MVEIAQRSRAAHALVRRRDDPRPRRVRGGSCSHSCAAMHRTRSTAGCVAISSGRRRWWIDTGGSITWYEDLTEEESPWLQVWSAEGELLYQNFEARAARCRRHASSPGARRIAWSPSSPTDAPVRVLTRRGRIGDEGGGHPGRALGSSRCGMSSGSWCCSSCWACRLPSPSPDLAATRSHDARSGRSSA